MEINGWIIGLAALLFSVYSVSDSWHMQRIERKLDELIGLWRRM